MFFPAKRVDSDKTANNQDPHYLLLFLTETLFVTMDVSKLRDGSFHYENTPIQVH